MLRAIGTAHELRPNGCLPRIGTPPSAPWDGYIAQISAAYQQALGPNLLSVAVRGSTVRATAVIGLSDLDLVAVTSQDAAQLTPPHIIAAPDLEVETVMTTRKALFEDPELAFLRFSLAHCGHTVWGEDFIRELPDPVLDGAAICHLGNVQDCLSDWPKMMAQAPDPRERKRICTWLMKRVVRALFESVMLKEKAYSCDIQPCAGIAARHYPTHRGAIFAAAELAVMPVADVEIIKDALAPLLPLLRDAQAAFEAKAQPGGSAPSPLQFGVRS